MEKWQKFVSRIIVFSLATFLLVGCGANNQEATDSSSGQTSQSTDTASNQTLTVEDQMGRSIELEQPAERLYVEMPSDVEILYAIGAGDKIVGRGQFVDYPAEEVEAIPVVDNNAEEIIALDTDVAILGNLAEEDYIQQLEDAGVKVLQFNAQSFDDIYDSIEKLGKLVGHEDQAAGLIEEMKTTFADLEKAADEASSETQTAYYEISPLEYGLWTGGSNTFMSEIGNLLNLENVFSDIDQWSEVSEEQVLEANPDFIITTNDAEDAEEEIMNRPGWDAISAVQTGNVYAADNSEFTRPGPRLMEAAQKLFDFIYGDQAVEEDQAA